jgi:hypothetical protein
MGKILAEASPIARAVFEEVDEPLGQNLFRLMCDGPESDLTLTENAQPAIMANAIATLRVLEREWELDYAPAVFLCLELVFIAVTPVPGDPPEARREFILRADAAGCTDNSLAHLLGITPASVRVARSRANKPRVVKRPAVSSLMVPLYAKFPDMPPLVIDAIIAAYRSAHRALRKK